MTEQALLQRAERNDLAPAVLRRPFALLLLASLWLVVFFASLFAPSILDDADGTHANAARHMALSGDLVTLKVDGIRYLEKAPLPYWLDALSFRIFGFNTFAAHLPEAIAVLLLALLGYLWADRAFRARTALYTGLAVLTCAGVFLFTRIYIPEVLLSLFLCTALYCLLTVLNKSLTVVSTEYGSFASATRRPSRRKAWYAYGMWVSLALAVLTKGLVALVFFFGAATVYVILTGTYRRVALLKPVTGLLLFLLIAAPWHILAGLRNTGGMNGHGFFWFYFVNEHFLRFLGKRYPMDYNKLPGYLFWSLHLVWLFPWSLFFPIAFIKGFKVFTQRRSASHYALNKLQSLDHHDEIDRGIFRYVRYSVDTFATRTTLLLTIYATLVLLFFSISTNQEYYTFPAYLPLLMLIAAALSRAEIAYDSTPSFRRWLTIAHAILTVVGVSAAGALAYGLWSSRNLPFVPDIGDLLAHRGVGDYTLSMSHFFDLTGPSFAALRLPASLAALAFAIGPAVAWILRVRRRHLASTIVVALTSAVFLIAAHIAFVRFAPMLSSQDLAEKIQELEDDHLISRDNRVLMYGDQSYGSSIPFYLGEDVDLVNGRSSSMIFGSTFPDAPPIFLNSNDLLRIWGTGERKILFVPLEKRDEVDHLLGNNRILLEETSGKALFTDRPLDHP
ncbi:ArnT family glycosyltransferase [Edaphobacter bradus]|uniref:ArnT family glycosyltransferase n=1 Tax=Edaphobacter bradus TaxID=2259016 RepID=UPI0021E0EEDA|nr:glycosyltransferase family 39 protein [Edaphobacter bradus]